MMHFSTTKKKKEKIKKCKHFNDCDDYELIKLAFQLGFHVYSPQLKPSFTKAFGITVGTLTVIRIL